MRQLTFIILAFFILAACQTTEASDNSSCDKKETKSFKQLTKNQDITIVDFKVSALECFCGDTRYKYNDPSCSVKGCSLPLTVKMKIASTLYPFYKKVPVECIFYDMSFLDEILFKEIEEVHRVAGKTTVFTLKTNLPHSATEKLLRRVPTIGVNCRTNFFKEPHISATARVTKVIDTTGKRFK